MSEPHVIVDKMLVAYDVFDKKDYWVTGYSVELNGAKEMALSALKYHKGGVIKMRFNDGSYEEFVRNE